MVRVPLVVPRSRQAYAADDGRSFVHDQLTEYESRWASEYQTGIDQHQHDAKCAHVLMTYIHHLTEDGKAQFHQTNPTLTLPTLPAVSAEADDKSKVSN